MSNERPGIAMSNEAAIAADALHRIRAVLRAGADRRLRTWLVAGSAWRLVSSARPPLARGGAAVRLAVTAAIIADAAATPLSLSETMVAALSLLPRPFE
jgi:hypothetical protein